MHTIQDIKDLALHSALGTAPADFEKGTPVDEALRDEFNLLAKDYNAYRRNKLDIFEIMQETIDLVVPKNVLSVMEKFAEVQTFANGQKVQFKVKLGRNRAKQFVTKVGLSGVYETFRLDQDYIDVSTSAVGGATRLDLERFLSGQEVMSDYMDIVLQGIEDNVYVEVQKALKARYAQLPAANKAFANGWDPVGMQKVCMTVKTYGLGANIFATPNFVAAMGADSFGTSVYSQDQINQIINTGYIGIFRGTPVVQLPQSFVDETNTAVQIDDGYAYIMPTGGEKVIKVAFEGPTIVDDYKNVDGSMEMKAYKKFGIAILANYNWGIYVNNALTTDDQSNLTVTPAIVSNR